MYRGYALDSANTVLNDITRSLKFTLYGWKLNTHKYIPAIDFTIFSFNRKDVAKFFEFLILEQLHLFSYTKDAADE